MSFRNIKSKSETITNKSYDTLRTSQRRPTDNRMWQNRYLEEVGDFAVSNWIPIVIGIIAGVAGAAGGFYVGQKYSLGKTGKEMVSDLIPQDIKKNLPQSLRGIL